MDWICPDVSPSCSAERLCEGCYGRALTSMRPQARTAGAVWAEHVARRPEHRAHASWPDDERAVAIARRKVSGLARDPRLAGELAVACMAGAATWWVVRPARYR